jgi:hypothetical protein
LPSTVRTGSTPTLRVLEVGHARSVRG